MIRKIRSGDILLAQHKELGMTNAYIITTCHYNGEFDLYCLTCGHAVCSGLKKEDIIDIINEWGVVDILHSDEVIDMANKTHDLEYPIRSCYKKGYNSIDKEKRELEWLDLEIEL